MQKYERKDHDLDEIKRTIFSLKTQLEYAKRIEVVRSQLKENEDICEKIESKVVSLTKKTRNFKCSIA